MTGRATTAPSPLSNAGWAALALAAGLGAAMAGSRGLSAALGVVAVLALSAFAVLVVRRLEVGLLALLLTIPLDVYGRILSEPVKVTLFHVVLLVCLGSFALRVIGDPTAWLHFSALDVGMAALLFAGVWSLPTSMSKSATVLAIVRIAFLWAMTLLYANGVRDRDQAGRLVAVLTATAVAVGLLAMAQFFIPGFEFGSITAVKQYGGGIKMLRAGGFFEDPNYLAGFLSVGFVGAFAMMVFARRRAHIAAWLAAAVIVGTALVATFSRTGWVGALVGCAAVGIVAPRERRAWILGLAALVLVAAFAVAPDQVLERAESVGDIERDQSVATRYYMTFSAQDMIRDMPVFGTGLGAFDKAYPRYRRAGTMTDVVRPHQIPLALWAETGIAGLLAEVVLLAAIVRIFWRKRPKGWTDLESVALGGVCALLAQVLFQYYLYFEYLWLYLALAVIAVRLAPEPQKEASV